MSLTAADVAALLPTLLPDRAAVYAADPTTGAYDVALRTNLRCRVAHLRGGQTAGQRAELLAMRSILFDAAYEMPDDAQVVVNGVRYDPVEGTFRHYRLGASVVRAVDAVVVQVET